MLNKNTTHYALILPESQITPAGDNLTLEHSIFLDVPPFTPAASRRFGWDRGATIFRGWMLLAIGP